MAATAHWHVDDIDDALAADFDGSLSGLGMELGTASFNMSDALMALPTISSLKQEASNKENGDNSATDNGEDFRIRPIAALHGKKNRLPHCTDDDVSSAIKRFCVSNERDSNNMPHSPGSYGRVLMPQMSVACPSPSHSSSDSSWCRHSSSAPDLRTAGAQSPPPLCSSPSSLSQVISPGLPLALSIRESSSPIMSAIPCRSTNSHFQYVLAAATSIATKMQEETMTYLNQGQSYEIKLKKLGDLTEMRGKLLKSVIRVGFQERRLQFMEKEQIVQWQQHRPGERIVEIDVPLSYGVFEVINDPKNINTSEFLWDPTKETGVFVRVNCISTEFTPKKHGGEKGVPFRIQIETYSYGERPTQRLHVASCQVKVFKPKGADRKHKTDREKMNKRSQGEQEKYQPSYDCTVFMECASDTSYLSSPPPSGTGPISTTPTSNSSGNFSPQSSTSDIANGPQPQEQNVLPPLCTDNADLKPERAQPPEPPDTPPPRLSAEASSSETAQWLQKQRFSHFVQTFSNFSGSDVMRLSRDDLIQICGLADGIRLYNSLHSRAIRPKLTLYLCQASDQAFRALYLDKVSVAEFSSKLVSLYSLPTQSLLKIFLLGPSGIRIIVTDEVVRNMQEESMFIFEVVKDQSKDQYRVILKAYQANQ